MLKACSEAARKITPRGVFAVLHEHGADDAKQVPPEKRVAVLLALEEAVKAAA